MSILDWVESAGESIGNLAGDAVGFVKDAVAAGGSLFEGGHGLIGVALAGATLILAGPGAAITVLIASSAAASQLIRQRQMTAAEREFVEGVFGGSLPPNDKIILTNLYTVEGRAFTMPNAAGQIVVGLGDAYDDPMGYVSGPYPTPGQLLIHEIAHAWQIAHATFLPGLVCQGAWDQIRHTFGADVYNPGPPGPPWGSFNNEQQATIVDRWFQFGATTRSALYQYILVITGGATPPLLMRERPAAHTAVSWGKNRIDIFVRGGDGGIYHKAWEDGWFPSADPDVWDNLGGRSKGTPAVVSWGEGRLDIFVCGLDMSVYQKAWANNQWFPSDNPDDWNPIGGRLS